MNNPLGAGTQTTMSGTRPDSLKKQAILVCSCLAIECIGISLAFLALRAMQIADEGHPPIVKPFKAAQIFIVGNSNTPDSLIRECHVIGCYTPNWNGTRQ